MQIGVCPIWRVTMKLLEHKGSFTGRALGGAEGIRTPDLCSAIAALSHLSYSPGRIEDQAAKLLGLLALVCQSP